MEIQNLVPVNYANQRVLTTAQVAAVFETTPYRIRDNFRYAKKHFVEGRDYFKVEGEDLKALKGMLSDVGNSHSAAPIPQFANSVILYTEQGVARHCKMLNTKKVLERFAELKRDYFQSEEPPAVVEVQDKVGYVDKDNVAWLNAEFVARGLGFTTVAKSGNVCVRWGTVREYLVSFGYTPVAKSCNEINSGDYIPENMVYRLAMKANNERAVNFQIKIANEIMPSIRKYGCYSVKGEMSLFPVEEATSAPVNETERMKSRMKKQFATFEKLDLAVVYALLLSDLTVKIGVTDNLTRRIKELKVETKLDVFQFKTTAYMPREEALALEASLKEKYAADCLGGEYFDVRFVDLCKDL